MFGVLICSIACLLRVEQLVKPVQHETLQNQLCYSDVRVVYELLEYIHRFTDYTSVDRNLVSFDCVLFFLLFCVRKWLEKLTISQTVILYTSKVQIILYLIIFTLIIIVSCSEITLNSFLVKVLCQMFKKSNIHGSSNHIPECKKKFFWIILTCLVWSLLFLFCALFPSLSSSTWSLHSSFSPLPLLPGGCEISHCSYSRELLEGSRGCGLRPNVQGPKAAVWAATREARQPQTG